MRVLHASAAIVYCGSVAAGKRSLVLDVISRPTVKLAGVRAARVLSRPGGTCPFSTPPRTIYNAHCTCRACHRSAARLTRGEPAHLGGWHPPSVGRRRPRRDELSAPLFNVSGGRVISCPWPSQRLWWSSIPILLPPVRFFVSLFSFFKCGAGRPIPRRALS